MTRPTDIGRVIFDLLLHYGNYIIIYYYGYTFIINYMPSIVVRGLIIILLLLLLLCRPANIQLA